jgi:hypothetical protein
MVQSREYVSYEWECFQVLVYELADDPPRAAERKIAARLRRKKLGAYDQQRIDTLRNLKNQLQREITPLGKSRYYVRSRTGTAEFEDYDIPRMARDLSRQYPNIPMAELKRAIHYAVYLYYVH